MIVSGSVVKLSQRRLTHIMKETTSTTTATSALQSMILHSIVGIPLLTILYYCCIEAYKIRLYALNEYGLIIHEFDPYFNYRATEYLYEHGWYKFRTWFDYMVWYPLGRPVGTTIYPGMQVTAVLLKQYVLPNYSINDICCYIPAWFGVSATLAVAWLTYECTRSSHATDPVTQKNDSFNTILNSVPGVQQVHEYLIKPLIGVFLHYLEKVTGPNAFGISPRPPSVYVGPACAVAAATIMSIVPAHLLRSIGGGYDNESIAMTAMVMTYAGWCLSLRDNVHIVTTCVYAVFTGLAYFYMVAAWGGYVFVLNVVGVHAVVLVLLGRYSTKLHRAYTIFYVVGTALAIQVPVVGMTPLKSLEQLGPCLAFVCFQLIEICEIQKKKHNLSFQQTWKLRVQVFGAAATVGVAIIAILTPTGYFGPISSRVRGLFVKHTKTGNPLVDSVAEHQAASTQAYFSYLMELVYLSPIAWIVTILVFFNDSSSFLFVYGVAAYYFSHRMVRLILLTAPIASVLGGIFFGRLAVWMFLGVVDLLQALIDIVKSSPKDTTAADEKIVDTSDQGKKGSKGGKPLGKKKKENTETSGTSKSQSKVVALVRIAILVLRIVASVYAIKRAIPSGDKFYKTAHMLAKQISHPTIIQKGTMKTGEEVVIDDYREAYFWLRDNTEEDARIMAWWDYGYQITGIGNRTTIADGNTWNHEHIALLGRILTSPEKEAHRIARHLADYVLVWTGGGGDDVAKSPHLRRIANSVYRGLCREPTCNEFGFYSDHSPTEHMEASLLYKLHSNGIAPGVEVDKNRFREVFRSKYMKVRIYKILSVAKDSKEWVENNRICDAPGSWYCRGQYPPALTKILAEKKNFKQLEDFNVKGGDDSEYQKEYFENLQMSNSMDGKPKRQEKNRNTIKKLSPTEIDMLNEDWSNTDATTGMHTLIQQDNYEQVRSALASDARLAHIRSEDGRGPMFWAHEYGRLKIVKLLKAYGVSETLKDANQKTALDTSGLV